MSKCSTSNGGRKNAKNIEEEVKEPMPSLNPILDFDKNSVEVAKN